MKRKLLILPPIAIGIAVLAFFIAQREPPERKPLSERATPVRAIVVTESEIIPRVIGYGTVQPSKVWEAVAQVSGEAVYVHPDFKKGAILEAGTEIVRISPSDYELAIAQAEANIRSTDASLRELAVSEENTRRSLGIEQRSLQIRETELDRTSQLRARGTVSQSAVDEQTRAVLAQRKNVQDLQNALRLIPTQRAVQQEQRAVYEAQLASARLDLARTRIVLPFTARIAEANVEATQFIQVGQTTGVADEIETAEIEAQIPISRCRMLARTAIQGEVETGITAATLQRFIKRMGFEVIVRLRSGDQVPEWPGRFARISDTIDPKTRTIGVIAAVDGAYRKATPGRRPPLTKGMFVEIELRARALPAGLTVPRSALRAGRLYIADAQDTLEIRPVTVGLYQGDIATISEGLAAGERVVVSDLTPAIGGMLLDVREDKQLADKIRAEAAGERPLR